MRPRPAFTLFQLLVLLAILAVLLAFLLPLIARARAEALRAQKLNNLKQLGIACHNYHDANMAFPPGNDRNNFSASAYLLPYIEQDNVFKSIDFKKPCDDDANAQARKTVIKVYLSPLDPVQAVSENSGATNYLYSAGTSPELKNNDGIFFQDSAVKIAGISDGTSNTVMAGETLKGDGGKKAEDVKRQHVALKAEALKALKDETGVDDFKDNKNIAADRCAAWIDGRFLQGTFTATRGLNDARPDVDCGGAGGLSALRSLDDLVGVCMCDGSARAIDAKKMDPKVWKLIITRAGGEVVPEF